MLISRFMYERHRSPESNRRPRLLAEEDGTSFIELMIAIAVFVLGLSSLLGAMTSLTPHRQSADARAQATNFASSTFENLRAQSIGNILAYDVPVDNPDLNSVNITGIGPVTVSLFAVIPGGLGETATLVELGSDDADEVDTSTLPNPIEIRAVMVPTADSGEISSDMQITASTMISY